MPFTTGSQTITTTAALVGSHVATNGALRKTLVLAVPSGGSTVYVGGPTVTGASDGLAIAAGTEREFSSADGYERVYAIVAGGTQAVVIGQTWQS